MSQRTTADHVERGEPARELSSSHEGPQQHPGPALDRLRRGSSRAQRPEDVLRLQATMGNRATRKAIVRAPAASRLGHPIQAMLELGGHDDAFERQAHAIADQATSPTATRVERARPVGRGAGLGAVSPAIESQILSARGTGRSLPTTVQRSIGERMGASFDGVRVHTDRRADSLTRSLGALAFTTGRDIFFRHGQYDPGSGRGRNILAHEMAHVVQQTGGQHRIQRYFELGKDQIADDALVTADSASFPVQQEGIAATLARGIKAAIIAEDTDRKDELLTQLKDEVPAPLWQQIDAVRDDHPALRALLFQQIRAHGYYTEPVKKDQTATLRLASKNDIPSLLISDNGKLAVEATSDTEQAKTFFAVADDVTRFNEALAELSSVKLIPLADHKLTVPDWTGEQTHELVQVYAGRRDDTHQAPLLEESTVDGLSAKEEQLIRSLVTPEQCIEMAEFVTGKGLEVNPSPAKEADKLPESKVMAAVGASLVKFLLTYMEQRRAGLEEGPATEIAIKAATDFHYLLAAAKGRVIPDARKYVKLFVGVSGHKAESNAKALFAELVAQGGAKSQADEEALLVTGSGSNWRVEFMFEPVVAADDEQAQQLLKDNHGLDLDAIVKKYNYRAAKKWGWVRTASPMLSAETAFTPEIYVSDGRLRDDVERELARQLVDAKELPAFTAIAEEFGINEYASPDVGQAYASHRSGIAEGAPYHWAGVVAKDGSDTIVLENYQRGSGRAEDLRSFFTIYGPWRGFQQEKSEETWRKGTWYDRHAPDYPGIALVHKPSPKAE